MGPILRIKLQEQKMQQFQINSSLKMSPSTKFKRLQQFLLSKQ